MTSYRRFSPLAAVLLLSLAACQSQPQGGSALVATSVSQALSASDVTRVKVTVSGSGMTSIVVELAPANGQWGGLISYIPAGTNRTFLAEAFDSSNNRRFHGQTSNVTITANQTTAVALTLQEDNPQAPYGNEAPIIDSAVANPASIATGGTLSLTSAAHDLNAGDTITYAWSANAGTFAAPTSANTSWTAPTTTGIYTLTLSVIDSQGAAVSVSLAVNVYSGVATGNANVNITFNMTPVVTRITTARSLLDVGQSTTVSATATDVDADALTYAWIASCAGTWTNASSSSASFAPSSIPAAACNNCTLTVTVRDGRGGQTTGSLNLCIAASSTTERFPPSFTNAYQSATTASPGQTIAFDVTALDPQSSSMTFAWSADAGTLSTAQTTATTSRVTWTAPACADTAPTISAVVTNAYSLAATQAFSIPGLPACSP